MREQVVSLKGFKKVILQVKPLKISFKVPSKSRLDFFPHQREKMKSKQSYFIFKNYCHY